MITTKKPILYSGTGSAIDNYNSPKPTNNENWGVFDTKNQQHKYIMALCHTRQWTKHSERWGTVADMDGAFSDFLKSIRSPVQKPLQDMTPTEVSKIIVALGGIVEHKFKQK